MHFIINAAMVSLRVIGATLSLLLTMGLPASVSADCSPDFVQVNEDGFGDRFNIYIWSLREFQGYLYAGTLNQKNGAEIWRYDGTDWEQVVDDGLGNPENTGIRGLTEFRGQLYAGVSNETTGAGIWRSADGVTWEPVMEGGFGNGGNFAARGMIEFQGRLYVGFQANDGTEGELWRSPNGTIWRPVALEGFGFPNNSSMHTMEVFADHLYIGTRNTDAGSQLWRTSNGRDFEPVVGPVGIGPDGGGYDNPANGVTFDLHLYDGMLYAGTGNVSQGFGVYRSSDGLDFNQIGQQGFGDPDNGYAWRFHEYEGYLWLGVTNTALLSKGGSVFRSVDGTNWQELIGAAGIYQGYGFNDTKNWGVRSFETFQGKLYIGTAQCWFAVCDTFVSGGEIWEWPGESCP